MIAFLKILFKSVNIKIFSLIYIQTVFILDSKIYKQYEANILQCFSPNTNFIISNKEENFLYIIDYLKTIPSKSNATLEKEGNSLYNTIPRSLELKDHETKHTKLNLHFYYSYRDVIHFFGEKIAMELLDKNMITYRNRWTGDFYLYQAQDTEGCFTTEAAFGAQSKPYWFISYKKEEKENKTKGTFGNKTILQAFHITLKDKFAWCKKGGQEGLNNMLAIDNGTKKSLDHLKNKMKECFQTPELIKQFYEYSMNDVATLSQTDQKMLEITNNIITGTLKLDKKYAFNKYNLPDTTGTIVSKIFQSFIYDEFEKVGLLERFKHILKKQSINEDKLKEKGKISNAISGGSIDSLGNLYIGSKAILNTVVQGGRTNNEQPWEYIKTNILDLDMSGCYGSALRDYTYPIGLPEITTDEYIKDAPTLKQFLEEKKDELVDNLYTITIEGKINFSQNLLYSKIVDAKKIKQKLLNNFGDNEDQDVNGEFVILKEELKNTIITSDLLKTLRAVCSDQELKQIYNCKVLTAAYYPKPLQCNSLEEWVQKIEETLHNPNYSYGYSNETRGQNDKRARYWVALPLHTFIAPLIDTRKAYKNKIKQLKHELKQSSGITFGAEGNTGSKQNNNQIKEEIARCNARQELLKLIINTLYGIFASSFFDIGNTILANNITARARNDIWLYSRVIQGTQTITDGCAYKPEAVFEIRTTPGYKYKPSLESLSDLNKLKQHRNIKEIELGNGKFNWNLFYLLKDQDKINEFQNEIDTLVSDHIKTFLAHYNLKMNYNVEHKMENTGKYLFYIKRAHYIIKSLTNNIIYKIRGTSEKNNPVYLQIAEKLFEKLENYESNHDEGTFSTKGSFASETNIGFILDKLDVQEMRLNSLNDYKMSKKKGGKILVPGFSRIDTLIFKLDNLDLPFKNEKEMKQRKSVKYYKDYGPLLLEKSWDEVQQIRIQEYQNLHKKY